MSDGRWILDVDTKASELKHAIYILHSSSTLCKRKTIEKYGGFYEKDNCKLGEDYYLWLQIMFNHRIYRILKPLWWFHIEASESASAAAQQKCSQPFLTETERIKNNCPHYLLPVLDKWYAQYAIALAQELSFAGENRRAAKLIKQFPKMKDYRWEYFKLRTKMIAPQLIPMVRFFKQYARQV